MEGPIELVLPKTVSGRLVQGITRTIKKKWFKIYFNEDLDIDAKEK